MSCNIYLINDLSRVFKSKMDSYAHKMYSVSDCFCASNIKDLLYISDSG